MKHSFGVLLPLYGFLFFQPQLVSSFVIPSTTTTTLNRYRSNVVYYYNKYDSSLNSKPNNPLDENVDSHPSVATTTTTTTDNYEDIKRMEEMDPIYILPILTSVLLMSIGILYIGYIKFINPSSGIDVDFFMSLDETLNTNNNINDEYESILALPPLTPAEKIVGALFGPPNSNNY